MMLHGVPCPKKVVMLLLILLIIPNPFLHTGTTEGSPISNSSFSVSGWTFPWDEPTIDSISGWIDVLDEVSPYWYWILPNGDITATHNETENIALITFLRQSGIDLIPMISNNHEPAVIIELSRNMSFQSSHIQDIIDMVRIFNYQGIDINYENIPTSEKDGYANFIKNLSEAMHGIGKDLYVSVFPKVAHDEDREGPGGYDYDKIGLYADRVRIMTYNLHWSTAPTSGPITSIDWIGRVIDYASTAIPSHRIQLGVPQYGYDWVVNKNGKRLEIAENVSYPQVMKLKRMYNVDRQWNATSRTPYIEYRESNGKRHHLHYTDSESIMHQMKLVGDRNLAGVSIWKIGGEDPDTSTYLDSFQETGLDNMAPYIDIDFDSITAMRGQNITFSSVRAYDVEDPLKEILWDFGNGKTSNVLEPTYSYPNGGFYTASLTVKDSSGLINTGYVDVRIGPYSTFILDSGPDLNNSVTLNASESWDPEGILSMTWNMGDGTYLFHSEPVVQHRYQRPGIYNVSLTLINQKGYTDISWIEIVIMDTESPIAVAGEDIVTYKGYNVKLDARASHDNSGEYVCSWIIDEHGTFNGSVVEFLPQGPGTYGIFLRVEDPSGNSDTDSLTLTVRDSSPPIIDLVYPEWVSIGSMIEIDALGSYDNIGIENITWDLGDGIVVYDTFNISIPALLAGRIYITLHLYDAELNWNSSTMYIDIIDVAPPTGYFKIDPTPRDLNETYAASLESVDPAFFSGLYGVALSNSTYIFSVNGTVDDSGIGYIRWNFGDGNNASGPIVYHEYVDPGIYDARLTLEDIWRNKRNYEFRLLILPSWNASINEIKTIIDEYVNNTEYVEPVIEKEENEGIDPFPVIMIIMILVIVFMGLLEAKTMFSYQKRTLSDTLLWKRAKEEDDNG